MYITINDVTGEKRINLAYPIQDKEVAVLIMLNGNVQYWLKEPTTKMALPSGDDVAPTKGVYTDKELNAIRGPENVLRENKLKNFTKMVISLDELNDADNLEDGRPSNTLFTYYVSSPKYFTRFEPQTPQYKKLKNGKIVSLRSWRPTENDLTRLYKNGDISVAIMCS